MKFGHLIVSRCSTIIDAFLELYDINEISRLSIINDLALVVVIVVQYCLYRQRSMLEINQDFHTQMWHKEFEEFQNLSEID